MSDVETEIKFLVTNPCVIQETDSWFDETIPEWTWRIKKNEVAILDTYFDTIDRSLSKTKWGLRLRAIGSLRLLTLKGPARISKSGAVERQEFERRFSDRNAKEIIKIIVSLGISLNTDSIDYSTPEHFLNSLGLFQIQRRKTARSTRDVFRRGRPDRVAEFAMDTVFYTVGDMEVEHSEIEVERSDSASMKDFEELLVYIKNRSGQKLKVWTIDKLALGFILEDLWKEGMLTSLMTSSGGLSEGAYDLILEKYLGWQGCFRDPEVAP